MRSRKLAETWRRNRSFVLFLLLMVVFRSSLADWNSVPTGSMLPTIVPGDRILVDKMAFDLNVPLTHWSLHRFGDPERGDIVTFDSAIAKTRLVKRVVGRPGDTIQLVDNRLFVNGQPAQYSDYSETPDGQYATETVAGVSHRIRLDRRSASRYANFGPVTLPSGHYFMMGDNRDNSADSRVIGPVPRDEIVGRTRRVAASFNPDNYYLPRKDRLLRTL
ncbi:signal peptidase I [Tahibacter amnicola]|uniref:Signal peptidase I n=1 Tax=Tahibacter amnicola TaxID=2976241 RepID=A0ABY6B8M9_9GAMM|nr:signal peptidase I [Tahibacter amnicola]UXI65866.1 signal peptidase I [Tahibacter amnicola]